MNLHTINVIISREYLTRVKKKSFLLITFLGPIFFAAICILPSVIMFMAEDKGNKIAVVDDTHQIVQTLENTSTIEYLDYTGACVDSLKLQMEEKELTAVLHIPAVESLNDHLSLSLYSGKPVSVDVKTNIKNAVDDSIEDYRIRNSGVDGLQSIINEVKSNVDVSTFTLEEGEEKITSSEVYMFISLIMSMIIYMFIAMFSGMVMTSVIEEKASRVVEVLVSSVRATELMFGKIIGVACVALTQFFLWVALTAVLVIGISSFVGFDKLMAPATMQTEQMNQMTGMMGVDQETLDASGMAMTMPEIPADNEMAAVMSTLASLDYGQLILAFVIYFILGYLLYASFFAAIGSAVENEADTQQLQIPVTIPLLIAFFIAFYAFNSPDSAVVFWGSMIPFTSPIVMLARIPFGVPGWEIILSIVLLLLTFIGCAWASAKIYNIGILMFGKKTTFKELWKWLKQK